jgi:hypothetical protein
VTDSRARMIVLQATKNSPLQCKKSFYNVFHQKNCKYRRIVRHIPLWCWQFFFRFLWTYFLIEIEAIISCTSHCKLVLNILALRVSMKIYIAFFIECLHRSKLLSYNWFISMKTYLQSIFLRHFSNKIDG